MILHLVNKPSAFAECIAYLAEGDCVALIEAAASREATELFCAQLETLSISNITIYAVENTHASPIDSALHRHDDQVDSQSIDMNKLVELTTRSEKVVSWY